MHRLGAWEWPQVGACRGGIEAFTKQVWATNEPEAFKPSSTPLHPFNNPVKPSSKLVGKMSTLPKYWENIFLQCVVTF